MRREKRIWNDEKEEEKSIPPKITTLLIVSWLLSTNIFLTQPCKNLVKIWA